MTIPNIAQPQSLFEDLLVCQFILLIAFFLIAIFVRQSLREINDNLRDLNRSLSSNFSIFEQFLKQMKKKQEAGRDISSFFESGKKSTSKSKELPTDDKFGM